MLKKFFNSGKPEDQTTKFSKIYNDNFQYAYAFIYARTAGNKDVTEEILQETFTAVWQGLDAFMGKSSAKTWICSIAKNKLNDFYRKTITIAKSEVDEIELEISSSFNVEEVIISGELHDNIVTVLNKLNPIYRHVLVMKYVNDYSLKEIAKIINRTPKAVDGIIQRGKACFIKCYKKLSEVEVNE